MKYIFAFNIGRILNRFSKDMGSMDELLPPAFFDVLTVRKSFCTDILILIVASCLLRT